jgi:hypothetical protein
MKTAMIARNTIQARAAFIRCARVFAAALLGAALLGCGDQAQKISDEEMQKKVAAIEQNFPITGLVLQLKTQAGVELSGSARIESLRIGSVKTPGFAGSHRPAFLLEGLTVDTDGGDLRILSEIAPALKPHGPMSDLLIKGLRVRKADGTTLVECAEARSRGAAAWELRGVRVDGGAIMPLGELDWSTDPGGSVRVRPLQEGKFKKLFR